MMNADRAQMLLDPFHDAIVGLRTAQIGRANANLAHLVDRLAEALAQLPVDAQSPAAGVIQAMLAARERDDAIGLADLLQYQMPPLLAGDVIDPALLDLDIIGRLRELNPLVRQSSGLDALLAALHTIQRDHPRVRGITNYHAAQLYLADQFDRAEALLQTDEAIGHRTPLGARMLALIKVQAGAVEAALPLVDWAYTQCGTLTDAYAEVAWVRARRGDWPGALAIARRDEEAARLTAPWQLKFAEMHARCGDFDRAEQLVATAYQRDESLRDGLINLALVMADLGDLGAATALAGRDHEAARLSAEGQLRFAQLLGRAGDFDTAAALVDAAYRDDGGVRDGYARLGWVKARADDWAGAHALMSHDRERGRLSPYWTPMYAVIEGHLGRWQAAEALLDEAYTATEGVADAHAQLGWHGFLLGLGPDFFQQQIAKDQELGRHTTQGRLFIALHAAATGDVVRAIDLTEAVYRDNPYQRNGFASLGWLLIRQGDPVTGGKLLNRDHRSGRLDPEWYPTLAVALRLAGEDDAARAALDLIAAGCPDACDRAIGFPSFPDTLVSYRRLDALVGAAPTRLTLEDLQHAETLC